MDCSTRLKVKGWCKKPLTPTCITQPNTKTNNPKSATQKRKKEIFPTTGYQTPLQTIQKENARIAGWDLMTLHNSWVTLMSINCEESENWALRFPAFKCLLRAQLPWPAIGRTTFGTSTSLLNISFKGISHSTKLECIIKFQKLLRNQKTLVYKNGPKWPILST